MPDRSTASAAAQINAPAPARAHGLTSHERADAEQVARRLIDELRALVTALPQADQGASAMSRTLGIDRVTCQRIVASVGKADVEPEILIQLPGVQGLRQFLEAMRKRRGSRAQAEQLAAAGAAIDRFQSLLDSLGGSQRRLRARIMADSVLRAPAASEREVPAREALFAAAGEVTGRWSETLIDVRIVRPLRSDPGLTEGLRVRGYLGHRAHAEALPLEMGGTAPLQARSAGPAFVPLTDGDGPFLPEFCSRPLPQIISRSAADRTFQLIEPAPDAKDAAMDVVIANRAAQPDIHPAAMRPAIGEMWTLITFPARRMVYDVFLHREIARRCIPSLEVHLRGFDTHPLGSRRWSTRFPGHQRLEVLSTGLAGVRTNAYSRHQELIETVLTRVGWRADEFVGFRCEVEYPIWRAGYCTVFDFTGSEIPERTG